MTMSPQHSECPNKINRSILISCNCLQTLESTPLMLDSHSIYHARTSLFDYLLPHTVRVNCKSPPTSLNTLPQITPQRTSYYRHFPMSPLFPTLHTKQLSSKTRYPSSNAIAIDPTYSYKVPNFLTPIPNRRAYRNAFHKMKY